MMVITQIVRFANKIERSEQSD